MSEKYIWKANALIFVSLSTQTIANLFDFEVYEILQSFFVPKIRIVSSIVKFCTIYIINLLT